MKAHVLLITALLLPGCAEYTAQPLTPTATLAKFEARSLRDQGLRRFTAAGLHREPTPWPPTAWDFDALTLAALYYHPDMAVARSQRDLAEAGEITAGQRPNPSLAFSPTYVTNIASVPFTNPWIMGLNPDIPIETAGKRDDRIAHAQHLTESARMKIAAVAWQVRSRLRASLLNLHAARSAETLRAEQLAQQRAWFRLLEQRLAVGEISRPELTTAHLALAQADLALREAQRQAAETQVQLADALGVPASALSGLEISFEAVAQPPSLENLQPGTLRRQALLNRADILAALADYAATEAALQLEIAKQYPDVHLSPGYIFNQGEYKWVFGLSLSLPVLNQNQGPIAEAEARRKEAAARFEALQAKVAGEIDRTLAGAVATRQKLAAAEQLLADQARQRRSAEALFRAGETDRLALVAADLEYATTALARLDAQVKAQQALGLLEDALQRPLDDAIALPPMTEAPPGDGSR
ncbi:TolC family protein [Methylomagnum ishizawai]|nr:TolC family protein [Methylomagnum ishizawai]